MTRKDIYVGALEALAPALDGNPLDLAPDARCVLLGTPAAFTGIASALATTTAVLAGVVGRVEPLALATRAEGSDPAHAATLRAADVVVVVAGSALHARTVWRASAIESALLDAAHLIVIGEPITVFGDVMVDPRGGAPTIGLGRFADVVVSTRQAPSDERTATLLPRALPWLRLGPADAVLDDGTGWFRVTGTPTRTRDGVEESL